VYKDKFGSIERFIERFHQLPANVQQRLVIENDDRLYSLADCLEISDQTGSPVLFDTFHHNIFNKGESLPSAFQSFTATWGEKDGTPMIDYSSQSSERRVGSHADHIDSADFLRVLKQIKNYDVDIMLEIKDKEKSALAALAILACEVPALLATPK
jgi:UV DNA damage endonuclease